jgi:hypothetical protein
MSRSTILEVVVVVVVKIRRRSDRVVARPESYGDCCNQPAFLVPAL